MKLVREVQKKVVIHHSVFGQCPEKLLMCIVDERGLFVLKWILDKYVEE